MSTLRDPPDVVGARRGRTDPATRPYAVAAGVLLILATAASVASQPLPAPVRDPDVLTSVAAHQAQVGAGALLAMTAAFASAGVAVALYPVLRHDSPGRAVGAVAFRVIEAVAYLAGVTMLLSLVSLGRQFVADGQPDRAAYLVTAKALLAAHSWLADVGQPAAFSARSPRCRRLRSSWRCRSASRSRSWPCG
jgi:Domain of unknown function (DUF4386)